MPVKKLECWHNHFMGQKQIRQGASFVNAKGTAVVRRTHFWTPPKPSNKADQETNPQRRTALQRKIERQTKRLKERISEFSVPKSKLGKDFMFMLVDANPNPKLAKLAKDGVTSGRQVIFLENLNYHNEEIAKAPFGFKTIRKKIAQFDMVSSTKLDFSSPELEAALRKTDSDIIIEQYYEIKKDLLAEIHALADRNDYYVPSVEKKGKEILSLFYANGFLMSEMKRRSAKGDDSALQFVKSYDDIIWALAHEEKEMYGRNFLEPAKELTVKEVAEYLGCSTDEVEVYAWTGLLERKEILNLDFKDGKITKPDSSNDPDDMRFAGWKVMQFKEDNM
jgi:hypothetical protein